MNNLNFIVFGVARSGTTALTSTFNLHPEIFCGVECFHPALDHSELSIPDDFTNFNVVGERKAEKNKELMGNKNKSVIYGNKFPRYYLHLDNVVNKTSGAIPIGIHRESLGFLPSWNDRAEVGTGWHKGRGGVAGIIEQFVFLSSILESRSDCKIFSYNELFFDNLEMIEKLYASVKVSATNDVIEKYKASTFQNDAVMNKVRVYKDIEKYAIELLEVNEIDTLFRKNSGEWFSSYSSDIREVFHKSITSFYKILPDLLDGAGESGRAYIKTQIRDYGFGNENLAQTISKALSTQA